MLKKFLIVLSVLVLFSGTASAQDQHIGLRLSLHYEGEETVLDTDILFGEEETLLFSGLFPSYVISAPSVEGMEMAYQDGLSFTGALSLADFSGMITEWQTAFQAEEEYGVFAGDLFDTASVKQTGSCSLDALIDLFLQIQNAETGLNEIFSGFDLPEEELNFSTGIQMDYSVFDSGKYFTLDGKEENRTVFTASFDFSLTARRNSSRKSSFSSSATSSRQPQVPSSIYLPPTPSAPVKNLRHFSFLWLSRGRMSMPHQDSYSSSFLPNLNHSRYADAAFLYAPTPYLPYLSK